MPARDSKLLTVWAQEGLIHASTLDGILPRSTPDWIKQALFSHSYAPYIYWLKDLTNAEREEIEKREDAIIHEKANGETGAAAGSVGGASVAEKPLTSPAQEAPSPAPAPKPETKAPLPANPVEKTPSHRTLGVINKTWERLHFSPYASNNVNRALKDVFAEFEDKSFLLPNVLKQDVPQMAPEAYAAICEALPEKEWQELLKITAAMKSQTTKGRRY
jgi:hypothetical protein